jgi:hypothetical protein
VAQDPLRAGRADEPGGPPSRIGRKRLALCPPPRRLEPARARFAPRGGGIDDRAAAVPQDPRFLRVKVSVDRAPRLRPRAGAEFITRTTSGAAADRGVTRRGSPRRPQAWADSAAAR